MTETDLEITKLCAQAMRLYGNEKEGWPIGFTPYEPLNNDEQAAALDEIIIKNGAITISANEFRVIGEVDFFFEGDMLESKNRRRARCECVAYMQPAKER